MPTTAKLRSRLINKLKELFQLDQPDLDFGFYRIMHAKSEQVIRFLDKDLLAVITKEFGKVDDSHKAKLKANYEAEVKAAKDYGVKNPENSPKVQDALKEYQAVQDTASVEGEIYDHLYRFFERYYDNGDFISLRYHTRETSGKAAAFAIPYNGEEVKLHWANADQYYIKTTEHFNNFTVDLSQAKEVKDLAKAGQSALDVGDDKPCLVHFRIVDATEGEHGNIKASEVTKRYFIIHKKQPVLLDENKDLVIQFEYRPDSNKQGQENTWRDVRESEAIETVISALDNLAGARKYKHLLSIPAATKKDSNRPLLAKYTYIYIRRNTMDYFIHKDLGAFLGRELDFYIKNEIMRLDGIQDAEVSEVETYLSKIKVFRTIAHKLIDFLAQLENFQKRLWLKRKFVVETNYCITLDRIPEYLYSEIVANTDQQKEWVQLFAINSIKKEKDAHGYSKTLSVEFLKKNKNLVLDTRFFDENFKDQMLASMENIDKQCNGLLIHSENFQALNLLQERYVGKIDSIYIDPPYNTATSEIIYKNSYKHSSWISLMQDRVRLGKNLLNEKGFNVVTIDYAELFNLGKIIDQLFSVDNQVGIVTVFINPKGRQHERFFSSSTEYMLVYAKNHEVSSFNKTTIDSAKKNNFPLNDEKGNYRLDNFARIRTSTRKSVKPKFFYPIYVSHDLTKLSLDSKSGYHEVYPTENGISYSWKVIPATFNENNEQKLYVAVSEDGEIKIYNKFYEQQVFQNIWTDKKYFPEFQGTHMLKNMMSENSFSYPKSVHAVHDILKIISPLNGLILDYFSGSGTTGHAVINLNQEDNGKRRYVLVEMGDYFDTVLKPRITKAIYSDNWKDGKPIARHPSISHCFKYIRLESYEDCLNNLLLDENESRNQVLENNRSLREDYMLHYLLDVETCGSQSLLNINEFIDPTAYKLRIKKPGSDQYTICNLDLMETFNYLIGLRVTRIAAPQSFKASFQREKDPELPKDDQTRLALKSRFIEDAKGPWWFRKVEGWVPADPNNPNNGEQRQILIIWRKLTGSHEEDNLMLNEWFQRNRAATKPFKYDTIYTNGSNNLPSLKRKGDTWVVRLIEEDFMRLMWDVEDI